MVTVWIATASVKICIARISKHAEKKMKVVQAMCCFRWDGKQLDRAFLLDYISDKAQL